MSFTHYEIDIVNKAVAQPV